MLCPYEGSGSLDGGWGGHVCADCVQITSNRDFCKSQMCTAKKLSIVLHIPIMTTMFVTN